MAGTNQATFGSHGWTATAKPKTEGGDKPKGEKGGDKPKTEGEAPKKEKEKKPEGDKK